MLGKQTFTRKGKSHWSGKRAVVGAVSCLLALAHASPASAVTDEERAGARAAANAGADAFDAGRWSDAIQYFQKAESLVHAPPHLLFMARASEKLGHLVAAREEYLKITREQLAAGAPQAFRDAQSAARSELAALEPRVPRVSVVVQGAGDLPVRVAMNGKDVAPALVGVPRPLDPGNYEFQAFAQGAQSAVSHLSLQEGAKETVVLTLQAGSAPQPEPAAAAVVATPPSDRAAAQDTGTQAHGGSSGLRLASYASLGVGAVGLGLGTVFALKAKSKRDEANGICDLTGSFSCPEDRRDEVEQLDADADSAKTLATVGFIAGGVGIAAGATLFFLSSSGGSEVEAAGVAVTPWVGFRSVGLNGRF